MSFITDLSIVQKCNRDKLRLMLDCSNCDNYLDKLEGGGFMKNEYTFSLYVSGIKLTEINPLDSAKLLESLCKMLGAKNLEWGDIKEGSADYCVKFEYQYFDEKVENFQKSFKEQTGAYKTITEFLNKYPNSSTLLRYKSAENDDYVKLHDFKRKEDGLIFTQQESIRGRVVGLKEGSDKTDHIQVSTIAGKNISVAISPALLVSLGNKWRTQHQLQFTGKAKYKYRSYDDIELIEFVADNIQEVKDGNILDWIQEFKDAGGVVGISLMTLLWNGLRSVVSDCCY